MPAARHHLKRAAAMFVAAILLLAQGAAAAEPLRLSPAEQAWLKANASRLVLYYDSHLSPLEFQNTAGQHAGLSADLIERLEAMLGVSFIRKPIDDWNVVMPALESGACALIPTIIRTSQREEKVFFTSPYFNGPMVIITRKDVRGQLTLAKLQGRRVGAVSGYITEKFLRDQALISAFEVVPVSNIDAGLRKLAGGEIDAFVESLAAASNFMRRNQAARLRVAGKTAFIFDVSIGVSRKYPLLYSSIQKAMDAIPESELAGLRRKWIPLAADSGLSAESLLLIKLTSLFAVLLLTSLGLITLLLKHRLNQRVADLRQSEKKYRRLSENSPAVVYQFAMRPDGSVSFPYISQTLQSVIGLKPEDAMQDATALTTRIHPDDRANVHTLFVEPPAQPPAFHSSFRLGKPDGQHLWVEAWATPERQPDGSLLWDGFFVDISERKQAEEALLRSEAKLRALFGAMQDVILVLDQEGRYVEIAPTSANLLYRPAEQFLGRRMAEVLPAELVEPGLACIHRALAEGVQQIIDYQLEISGRPTWFTASVSRFTADSVLWMARDMTEREQLRAQLNQAQKLDSISRLAGGVAHDFNNMLGVIIGYAEMLLEQLGPEHQLRPGLEEIRKAAQRSSELTRQLLTFARKQNVTPKLIDLNAAVASMLKMLRRLIGEDIALDWQPGAGLEPLLMDPSQVDQILANLCVNARDAIGGTGAITISTATTSLDAAACAARPEIRPGDFAVLTVSDNGCGMPAAVLEKLFEPFFTTKEPGRGTGLGLATVYGIVKQNRGFITVASAPGQGATFKIHLPLSAEPPEQATAATPPLPRTGAMEPSCWSKTRPPSST